MLDWLSWGRQHLDKVENANRNAVLVLDENNRLFRREVSIARWDGEIAWVKEGLREGEKVCLTPIGIFAAGMEAQPVSNRK